MRKILLLTAVFALLLTSCQKASAPITEEMPSVTASEMFEALDSETGWSEAEAIAFDISNGGEITEGGTYVLSGKTESPVSVNAGKNDVVRLILNGIEISSSGKAPISIMQADKVYITLADGSENVLTLTAEFDENDSANSALYSKCDLTINGEGTLTVNNPYGHGIEAKDDLFITGGSYNVTVSGHGFEANDSIRISNGVFNVIAERDGFHAENEDDADKGFVYIGNGTFNVTSGCDGISASSYMTVENGIYNIVTGDVNGNAFSGDMWLPDNMEMPDMSQMPQLPDNMEMPDMNQKPQNSNRAEKVDRVQTGGERGQGGMKFDMQWGGQTQSESSDESMKGLKASGTLNVNGGVFKITSSDDCLHSNSDLKICGGDFTLSTGDDAFHSDGNLTFENGTVKVTDSYEALEGESIDVLGGTFELVSSDDGLNAAGGADSSGFGFRGDKFGSSNSYINISGGSLTINADGDGIDSNGSLKISGGEVTVLGPVSNGDAPVDWQTSGEITGGTFIAVGSLGMASNFTSAQQGSVYIALDSTVESGKTLTVSDKDGNVILTKILDKSYNSILVSTPQFEKNGSYTVTVDGKDYEVSLNGYTYSKGSSGGFGGGFGNRGQKNREKNM